MQKKVTANAKRALAVALACSMALAAGPVASAKKSAKAPKLSKTKKTIDIGKSFTLKVVKNGFTIKNTTWKSSDKLVATVSKKGKVTGKGDGGATISAKVKYTKKGWKKAKTKTLKCKVTVNYVPDEYDDPDGGWTKAQYPNEIDNEVWYNVDLGDTGDYYYEAVATLATQVVAGIKYRFLCRKIDSTGSNAPTYSIVEVLNPADGSSSLPDVFDSNIQACPAEVQPGGFEMVKDKDMLLEQFDSYEGGFVTEDGKKLDEKIIYIPVAIIERQASTHPAKLKMICEYFIENSDAGENPSYAVVEVTPNEADGTFIVHRAQHFSGEVFPSTDAE